MTAKAPTYPWRADLTRGVVIPWGRKYEHVNGRGNFVAITLKRFLVGKVLDVGAGRNSAVLRDTLGSAYEALDLERPYQLDGMSSGKVSDNVVDLEQGRLPFADGEYDTVICTDVLEHVDHIYEIYDELFRVAKRHVIISLPNNWVNFFGSFLAGRNVTHMAGYGLPPQPKRQGERHKYFFNFEEASDFLAARVPSGFKVCAFDQRFEYGLDGVLCSFVPVSLLFRGMGTGKLLSKARRRFGGVAGALLACLAFPFYYPLRLLDVLLGTLVWGWGKRVRYYNLFCRQIWMVYERVNSSHQ